MDSLGIRPQSPAGLQEDARVGALRRDLQHADPEQAGKKLEALFATMLVKEMRRSLPNGFFGDSSGSDTFNGWFDEHIGGALAESGALDLAGMVKTSLGAGGSAAS
jgi:Rod binding domain-containing protein